MFSPTRRTLARTFLDPSSGRFTKPVRVMDQHANATPQLAANLNGQFVASWFHAHRGSYELRANTGAGLAATPHSLREVAPARQHPGQVASTWTGELNQGAIGISGLGYAVVTWERISTAGPHGLFIGLHKLT
jgi:hypothetical protein